MVIFGFNHQPGQYPGCAVAAGGGFLAQLEKHGMVHADFLGQRTPRQVVLLAIGFKAFTELHSLTRLWGWFILSTTKTIMTYQIKYKPDDSPLAHVNADFLKYDSGHILFIKEEGLPRPRVVAIVNADSVKEVMECPSTK